MFFLKPKAMRAARSLKTLPAVTCIDLPEERPFEEGQLVKIRNTSEEDATVVDIFHASSVYLRAIHQ